VSSTSIRGEDILETRKEGNRDDFIPLPRRYSEARNRSLRMRGEKEKTTSLSSGSSLEERGRRVEFHGATSTGLVS